MHAVPGCFIGRVSRQAKTGPIAAREISPTHQWIKRETRTPACHLSSHPPLCQVCKTVDRVGKAGHSSPHDPPQTPFCQQCKTVNSSSGGRQAENHSEFRILGVEAVQSQSSMGAHQLHPAPPSSCTAAAAAGLSISCRWLLQPLLLSLSASPAEPQHLCRPRAVGEVRGK